MRNVWTKRIYSPDIGLTLETTGETQVFLHLKLVFCKDRLRIYSNNFNSEFVYGKVETQTQLRIGPFFTAELSRPQLQQYVTSRVTTFIQLWEQGVAGIDRSFRELFVELLRLQIPPKEILRCFRKFRGLKSHQVIDRNVRQYARHIYSVMQKQS